MSEEAERRFQEQKQSQEGMAIQTAQPRDTACSTFMNLNFESDGEHQSVVESKRDFTVVSA